MYHPAAPFDAVNPTFATRPMSVIWLPLSPISSTQRERNKNELHRTSRMRTTMTTLPTSAFQRLYDLLRVVRVLVGPVRM